ncbi:MAG: nuclear transport factor 2 family protein [Thermocrispum sp.]
MDTVQEFRDAVESGDFAAAVELFARDITFYSPVKFTPFQGIEAVSALLRVLARTFQDFRYVGSYAGRDVVGPDGPETDSHILHFRTVVDGKQVDGIDLVQLDEQGRIGTFTVMIRPMSAMQTVSEAVVRGLVEDGVLPAAS